MKVQWISYKTIKDFDESDSFILHGAPAPYFRKEFSVSKKIKKAVLTATSLGIFKGYINGQEVSNEYFAPGWTNYSKRILYREYDVTSLIEENNAIGFILGDGWYVGYLCNLGRNRYGKYPLQLYANLHIEFEDGTFTDVNTDETWKAGSGAIRENDFLYGEVFDSRLPHKEVFKFGFDDSGFENVNVEEDKSDRLAKFDYEPAILQDTLIPELVADNGNVKLYDLKQNFAGVLSLTCEGESGAKITLRHGETLDTDGTLYTDNLRAARAVDEIYLNGERLEYTPITCYHGFRYFEIITEGDVKIISVVGRALYNDLKLTGNVSTSSSLVNQIFSNISWGQKSNFIELPTDCPQRNERLGWSADTQVFCRTGMYNTFAKKFYEKHMSCIEDDRRGGAVPDVVPFFGVAPFDSAGWRDVAVVLPYTLWKMYGDREKSLSYIGLINDFIAQQISTSEDGLWKKSYYNDWLNVDEDSDEAQLATVSNLNCFIYAKEMFDDLGVDSKHIAELIEKTKAVFISNFVDENGDIKNGTQTIYAMAYFTGIIDKDTAKRNLLKVFNRRLDHIHSGFVGIRFILPALCEVGLIDLAYKLISNTTYPSWGYSIKNGATTMWERWNSYTVENGFEDKIMNSFNHYSFGSCGEWFYEYILGIKPKTAGFSQVTIKPYVDRGGNIDHAEGYYDSINGKISVSWKKTQGKYVCRIEKPSTIKADFVFENVLEIVQDGVKNTDFNTDALVTEVTFL